MGNGHDDEDDLLAEVLREHHDTLDSDEDGPVQQHGVRRSGRPVHPLTDMPDASEDIHTSYFFPDSPMLSLPIGQPVTLLCHARNNGESPMDMTYIMGSLNHPVDFHYYVQNFTLKSIMLPLQPRREATLEYEFQVHPGLQPQELQLAVTLFYQNEENSFSSTFFNKSVTLHAKPAEVDARNTVKTLVLVAALVCAALFLSRHFLSGAHSKTEQRKGSAGGDWGEPVSRPTAKKGKTKKG